MYTYPIRSDELYHFGVKGMHWGVRRYQNPDGTLTAAGRRRAMRNYDYTTSKRYANASKQGKVAMERTHRALQSTVGKRGARRVEYQTYEEKKNFGKTYAKEMARQAGVGLLAASAITLTKAGINAYNKGREYTYMNNLAANKVAADMGLKTVKGGFTAGFGGVKRGMKVVKQMVHH